MESPPQQEKTNSRKRLSPRLRRGFPEYLMGGPWPLRSFSTTSEAFFADSLERPRPPSSSVECFPFILLPGAHPVYPPAVFSPIVLPKQLRFFFLRLPPSDDGPSYKPWRPPRRRPLPSSTPFIDPETVSLRRFPGSCHDFSSPYPLD